MAHLTNFSFEFFYENFTEDASQLRLYHGAKKSKMTKNSNQGGPALIFLFESSWKNMKNDTTFVRMRSGNHLGDAKCRKKAPHYVEFNFLLIEINTNGFHRMKEERGSTKVASDFLIFAQGLSSDLSMFSDDFTPSFYFERHNYRWIFPAIQNIGLC